MTKVYFIRHAEPDFTVHDDQSRPLTEKGQSDALHVLEFFSNVKVNAFYSSPYVRSISTILPAAKDKGKEITKIPDFRERAVADTWIDDFNAFAVKQWTDFDYKLKGGESLNETKNRNTSALKALLKRHDGETIAVGSHGTAISTIIHSYDPAFGYDDFRAIQSVMPFIVLFTFEKDQFVNYEFVYPNEKKA